MGLSNERSVEIVKGITEGEEVYLFKPPGAEELKISEAEKKAQQESDWKKASENAARIKPPVLEPPDGPPGGKVRPGGKGGGDRGDRPRTPKAEKAAASPAAPGPSVPAEQGKRT